MYHLHSFLLICNANSCELLLLFSKIFIEAYRYQEKMSNNVIAIFKYIYLVHLLHFTYILGAIGKTWPSTQITH